MNQNRRRKNNDLTSRLKSINATLIRSRGAISRLRNSELSLEWVTTNIDRLNQTISDLQLEKIDIKENLLIIDIGGMDHTIQAEIDNSREDLAVKLAENEHLKEVSNEKIKVSKLASKNYWTDTVNGARMARKQKRDMQYGYRHYCRSVDTIPDWMVKKLKRTPCTTGYVWKGVVLYGDLPREESIRKTIEHQRGGICITKTFEDRVDNDGKVWVISTDWKRNWIILF